MANNKKHNMPETRLKHCYGVARMMYDFAKKHYKWNETKCQEMYVLGLIHDAGYEFVSKKTESQHASILSNVLKNDGYKYFREVKYHDTYTNKYQTEELYLLWLADMSVDGNGNKVSFEERLEDLENRHGKYSSVVKESKELIKHIKEHYEVING